MKGNMLCKMGLGLVGDQGQNVMQNGSKSKGVILCKMGLGRSGSKAGWGARLVGEQGRKIKQKHTILELASFERQRRLMFKRITA